MRKLLTQNLDGLFYKWLLIFSHHQAIFFNQCCFQCKKNARRPKVDLNRR